jgi:type II secretory pathway component PulF
MPRFAYRAFNDQGETIEGQTEAADRAAANAVLEEQHLVLVSLREMTPARKVSGRASDRAILTLMQQLAALMRARVGLLDVWEIAAQSEDNPQLRASAEAVASRLRAGDRLGAAWREAGPSIPDYAFRLIDVGEESGALAETLSDAATQMAFQQKIIADIRSAVAYPSFLVFAGLSVALFILSFVVPQFAEIARSNQADLPAMSAFVLGLGEFVSANFLTVLVSGVGAVVALVFLFRSKLVRSRLIGWLGAIPVAARLINDLDSARWAGVLALSLRHGVHLTEAIDLANGLIMDPKRRAQLERVSRDLREGETLATSLKLRTQVQPGDISIIRAGESAGALEEALSMVSLQRREAAETRLKSATTFFEPAAIMIVAMFVGLIVVSLVMTMTSFYSFTGA